MESETETSDGAKEKRKKSWRCGCLGMELAEGTDNPFGIAPLNLTDEDKEEILDAVTLVLSHSLSRELYEAIMSRHSGYVPIEPPVASKLKARAEAVEELFARVREQQSKDNLPRHRRGET